MQSTLHREFAQLTYSIRFILILSREFAQSTYNIRFILMLSKYFNLIQHAVCRTKSRFTAYVENSYRAQKKTTTEA